MPPSPPPSDVGQRPARAHGSPLDVVISHEAPPAIGGAHLWLYEVYRRWSAPVTLLTLPPSGDAEEIERMRAFDGQPHGALRFDRTLTPIPPLSLTSLAGWRALFSQVRSIRRAAGAGTAVRLHARCVVADGLVGALYKRLHPSTTLVTYAHGEEVTVFRSSRLLAWLATYTYRASDVVIANCDNTKRVVAGLCPDARITVIHPGVDAASYAQPAADVRHMRHSFGWPEGTFVLATVARMEARKNQAGVIRAVARLRADGYAVAYVCAGGGPEKGRLQQLAHELGVDDAVRFPGIVSDLEKALIFNACDVHVMPSIDAERTFEGFGMVFIEAAAAGAPSIAGASGGQREAVLDGVTGTIVNGEEPEQLAAAMRTLFDDAALRARMGEEGRRWAWQHDWPVVVRQTEALLADVGSAGSSSRA